MIGKRILHFRILSKLGEGGMGVVYQAQDTELDREVALKFLSTGLPGSSDEKTRFRHEAKAAAKLSHPNIAHIYEINEHEGNLFIAMEYIDGEDLSKRIERGPMPIDEAVDIAVQIADGLQAAHEAKILHRDIKSQNIMATPKGVIKIMDFGLAKLAGHTRVTKEGTTLGTAAYMSPEQARGDKTDHRSDIWSLGVVLYEMVCGQLPFKGDYEQAVVYSILNEEAEPPTGVRTGVPLELERIIFKAMAKNPEERYQHVDEIPVDLQVIKESSKSGSPETTGSTRHPASPIKAGPAWWKLALACGVILIAALLITQFMRPASDTAKSVSRLTISLPPDQQLVRGPSDYPLAVSPDGAYLVFAARQAGSGQLYIKAIERFEIKALPGTQRAHGPFFSPDGKWIGFFADAMLKKVAIDGGQPIEICPAPESRSGATWGPDDTIVFASRSSGLKAVSALGGSPRLITELSDNFATDEDTPAAKAVRAFGVSSTHYWPHFLPGGKEVLFTVDRAYLAVLSLDDGQWQPLAMANGEAVMNYGGKVLQAIYAPTGHLLFGMAGGIRAIPFDLDRRLLTGSQISAVDEVYEGPATGAVYFALAQNGTLIYAPGGTQHTLSWVNRQGHAVPVTDVKDTYRFPKIAPNGEAVAIAIDADPKPSDIWIIDVERGTRRRLTQEGHNIAPVWSPDSRWIAYHASDAVYRMASDGASQAEKLQDGQAIYPSSWSSDGELLGILRQHPETGWDIWIKELDGEFRPWLATEADETGPKFSPDMRWIAYQSDESGRAEVYIQPFPGPGAKSLISTEGGTQPTWSGDGTELFYRQGDRMMAVSFSSDSNLQIGSPRLLFAGQYDDRHHNDYDVSRDGKQFLMIELDKRLSLSQFNVVLNWFEELRKLVPVTD